MIQHSTEKNKPKIPTIVLLGTLGIIVILSALWMWMPKVLSKLIPYMMEHVFDRL